MAEESLSQKVANEIRNMIVVKKKYMPGDRLPNERTLALDLNVSRPAVREGIKYLVAEGFLEIRRGVGTFVSEELFGGISTSEGLDEREKKMLKDWYQSRMIMEVGSMKLVAENATDEDIKKLEKIVEETNCLIADDDSEYFNKDFEFHKALAEATGNSIIERFISKMGQWQWTYYSMAEGGIKEDICMYNKMKTNSKENHSNILKFIKERDAEGAMMAMRYHLLCAMRDLE